ncbi:MAG TPA: tetratricopeptide repeat protein [Streptosporangiaceae bacterium]
MEDPRITQAATGSYIAQAAEGGTAVVATYHVAPPPPVDATTLAEATQLLAQIPADILPAAATLPPHSRMPLARNDLFTGRTQELRWLASHLGSSPEQVPTVAVAGLGGVGKSQIASEYAHRFGRFYAGGVFWISLADAMTIASEVTACGGTGGMDLRPDFAALSQEDQLRLVLAAWQGPLPRLLIFDNCDNEETLTQWRPASGGCRVLVTSRRSIWDLTLGVHVLGLDVLAPGDSLSLLERYQPPGTPEDAVALADIAAELGQLPLALHLGGSYLRQYRMVTSPADYLNQLRTSPPIEHRSLTAAGISPTQHIQSIAATFAISVDQLATGRSADDLARRCIIHASYLAPGEAIPRDLLLATLGLSTSPDDAIELEDGLQRLATLGLAQLSSDGTPRLHRLIAAFVHDRLGDLESLQQVEHAVWELLSPRRFTDTSLNRARYEPHLRVLTDRALARGDLAAAALGNLLGLYLQRRSDRDAAVRYLRRALEIKEGLFGVDSPQTAKELNDLGFAFLGGPSRTLGQPYLERARRLWNPVTDAPDLAATLDNLGQLHMGMGRADLAEPFFHEALEIRERELGEYAYGTSVTVVNLAQIARGRGDLTGAVKLFKRAVDIRESIGDKSDPSATARSHLQLAGALEELGELAEADPHITRALELYRASLGPQHPQTLSAAVLAHRRAFERGDQSGVTDLLTAIRTLSDGVPGAAGAQAESTDELNNLGFGELNNLGFAFWLHGDYAAARRMYQLALGRGPDPTVLNNLGMIAERLGEYTAAVEHYQEALSVLREQRASRWGSALQARVLNNLGVSMTLGGDPSSGGSCLGEALAIRRQLQGEEGPEYAVTLRNLGLVAQREGRLDDAQRLIEQGRDLLARTHGVRSAEYARTMLLLGELLAVRGDDEAALTALETALAVRRTALGMDHPDTAVTLRALADVLRRKGRETEACEALRAALPIFEQHMGADHPWTIQLRAESKPCIADSTTS